MDFPGVTTVLQVGLPANAEQYIHRLGRTARAGAAGSGIIILAPFESFFLKKREIAALPHAPPPQYNSSHHINYPRLATARELIKRAMGTVDDETKAQFYSAQLGFYKPFLGQCFGSAEAMVQVMNELAASKDGLAYGGGNGEIPGVSLNFLGSIDAY
jgi:ATP-dependent RNA helicase MSS116